MQLDYQFVRYSLVGACGTAGHYATLLLLVNLGRMSPVLATVLGSVVGAVINYVLNYQFTFRSEIAHGPALSKFMLVSATSALVNLGIMWLGVSQLHVHYIPVQLFATAVVLLFGFVLNRAWTFRTVQ